MSDLILNVDDSNTVRHARNHWLQCAGLQVIESATGLEAVRLAEQFQPVVVLLDVSLPDISGFEVCRRLKTNPSTASIQVVHVTASAVTTEDLAQGLEAADSYLIEPVDPHALVAHVKALARTCHALRERESLLREVDAERRAFEAVLHHAPSGMCVLHGPDYVYGLVNPAYQAIAPGKVMFERRFAEVFPEIASAVVPLLDRVRHTGTAYHASDVRFDIRRSPDGPLEEAYISFSFIPIEVPHRGGEPSILAAVTETTEAFRVQNALRESETRERARVQELEAIMDAVPAAILVARDPACQTTIGNRLSGEAGIRGGADREHGAHAVRSGKEIPPGEFPVEKAAATGKPVRDYEFDLEYADGSARSFFGHARPMLDEAGRVRGAVSAFIETTERKRIEEQLRQAQKLESIGLLAGGVAHDFNNLLTGVIGSASLLLEGLSPEDPNYALMDRIVRAGNRAAELTRQLLAYSGKGRWVVTKVDLSAVVRDLMDLLRASLPATADIRLDLQSPLPLIEADESQMNQVVMNLVVNAGEALEERPGMILIRTEAQTFGEAYLQSLGGDAAAGEYVVLEVHDTGSGIAPDLLDRIFDPFFSTKFTGRGLGLAAVQGIIRAHRGAIHVDSTPGKGSSFRLLFPCSASRGAPTVRPPEVAASSAELRGQGLVLVVDDEETVRGVARAALERYGYSVMEAASGQQALEIFARMADQILIVLLDLTMPRMTGEEVVDELKRLQPGVRVLLSSGYSEMEAVRRFAGKGLAGFVGKPYVAATLARKIKAACASGPELMTVEKSRP